MIATRPRRPAKNPTTTPANPTTSFHGSLMRSAYLLQLHLALTRHTGLTHSRLLALLKPPRPASTRVTHNPSWRDPGASVLPCRWEESAIPHGLGAVCHRSGLSGTAVPAVVCRARTRGAPQAGGAPPFAKAAGDKQVPALQRSKNDAPGRDHARTQRD